jgi:hypothetical protein
VILDCCHLSATARQSLVQDKVNQYRESMEERMELAERAGEEHFLHTEFVFFIS